MIQHLTVSLNEPTPEHVARSIEVEALHTLCRTISWDVVDVIDHIHQQHGFQPAIAAAVAVVMMEKKHNDEQYLKSRGAV